RFTVSDEGDIECASFRGAVHHTQLDIYSFTQGAAYAVVYPLALAKVLLAFTRTIAEGSQGRARFHPVPSLPPNRRPLTPLAGNASITSFFNPRNKQTRDEDDDDEDQPSVPPPPPPPPEVFHLLTLLHLHHGHDHHTRQQRFVGNSMRQSPAVPASPPSSGPAISEPEMMTMMRTTRDSHRCRTTTPTSTTKPGSNAL
ncbi:hypothetical protein Daus18300_005532, partial [Diaporthe australafricana]